MSNIYQQDHISVSLLLSIILPHHSASSQQQQQQQQRQQRWRLFHHSSYSLTIIIILVLFLCSPVASQSFINNGCLSLANSTVCHGFGKYYIGTPALARYGLNTSFSTIDEFDWAIGNYTIGPRPYLADLGCYSALDLDRLFNSTKTFPYARYSNSRICAALVQDADSSLPCSVKQNVYPPPLCESTCEQWLTSVNTIITKNTDNVCPNTGQPSVLNNLNYLNSSCTDWSGFNGSTGNCMNGISNEYNCGFSNSTNDACDYCKQNEMDPCCQQQVISCSSGLSIGAIIGIVVAVVVALVAIGLVIFFFCFKRNKHIRKENSFSFKTYVSPSIQQQQQQQQQQLNTLGYEDGGDHYSGNKVLLQQNDHLNISNENGMVSTIATQNSKQTGHRSQLSDPFGDHYEVVSLANNPPTTTTTTPNTESLVPINNDDENGPDYEEEFYQVVHPYPPQVADELGLQVGDIVCLAMGFDDGWALGFNVTTGLKGVFPLVCVSLIPPSVLEQLLISSDNNNNDNNNMDSIHHNDVMADGLSTFSSKVLVEDDDQHSLDQRRLSRSSQLAISIRRIREDMRRSISLSSSYRHPSPLSASNSISSKSIRPSSPSPSYLSHQNIPKRTASIVRNNNNNNNNNYAECDSPTSPTHQTPLFNHHQPSPTHNDSFEMYHPSNNSRISKQES